MTNYTDSTGAPIQLTKELGAGGEGAVYTTNRRGMVAKILHDHKLKADPSRRAKIEWMMKNIPGEIYTPKTATNPRITNISWPTELVLRNGVFCGYLMPKITKSQELNTLINPSNRARQKIVLTTSDLYRLAHNICTVYRVFHAKDYVIGDINTKNIMVTNKAFITVVDCDSIQVRDSRARKVYPCKVGVREYTPPELIGKDFATTIREPHNDGFAIAVLVFQLLMQGHHPYSGIRPLHLPDVTDLLMHNAEQRIFPFVPKWQATCAPPRHAPDFQKVIPAPLQKMFVQAFTTNTRPTAEQWATTLRTLHGTMVNCTRDATHVHPRGSACTMCNWNDRIASAMSGKLISKPPSSATRGTGRTAQMPTVPPNQATMPQRHQPGHIVTSGTMGGRPGWTYTPTPTPTPSATVPQLPASTLTPLAPGTPTPPPTEAENARNGCTCLIVFVVIAVIIALLTQ